MPAILGSGRPRTLALQLVEALGQQIRDGRLLPGDKLPTESALVAEFSVSRTVVREAISKLQASGQVATRHGVGTFVLELPALPGEGVGAEPGFRIAPAQVATLRDVIAVLELRIGVETEAAGLAAQRREPAHLQQMRAALDTLAEAVAAGSDAVQADFQFHLEIARATRNPHFAELMATLGNRVIPRGRLSSDDAPPGVDAEYQAYLRRVQLEHESIFDAIQAQDPEGARAAMRTHLANSRERRRRAAAQWADGPA